MNDCIRHFAGTWVVLLSLAAALPGAEHSFRVQEISKQLTVGYAVRLLDMNKDGKLDIVVVDSERVIWFENPQWKLHTLIEGQTKKDNVSLAPSDIDGDGEIDFALAADWRPADTRASGSLQWIGRGKSPDEPWKVHRIGEEPTAHRIRFADLDGDGREELIVLPLFGRGTTGPHYQEAAVRILAYKVPQDAKNGPWTAEVLNDDLHVAHNFWPTDLNHDGRLDLLVASFEGVSLLERQSDGKWRRTLIGAGNQETAPNRGASEIKHGRLANGTDYLATIEPWHGFQVVVYLPPEKSPDGATPTLWSRHVIDEDLRWGHAVWCADLDADGDQELIIGVRDTKEAAHPCGVRIYDPQANGKTWTKQSVDPAGVAVEDLAVGDLDDDGRPDIVAVGRQTKNVRVYWNQNPAQAATPSPAQATVVAGKELGAFPPQTLQDATGKPLKLSDARGSIATVLVSLSVECPISHEYVETLNRLAKQFGAPKVKFIGINPNAGETLAEMDAYAQSVHLAFAWAQDPGGLVARALQWKVTPEVSVFDADGQVVYRGRIDNRYQAGAGGKPEETVGELELALQQLLTGKPITTPRTKASGCPIQWTASPRSTQ